MVAEEAGIGESEVAAVDLLADGAPCGIYCTVERGQRPY